ncbi:hypothetical protein D3C73_954110 [compost metagenome]
MKETTSTPLAALNSNFPDLSVEVPFAPPSIITVAPAIGSLAIFRTCPEIFPWAYNNVGATLNTVYKETIFRLFINFYTN